MTPVSNDRGKLPVPVDNRAIANRVCFTAAPANLPATLLAALLASAGPVSIAATTLDTAAQPDASGQLEEVTVTARRRQEPLQTVPVALSVVSGSQAAAHNLVDLQDISGEVPTVDFRTGASNKDRDIFVRGVGTITTSPGVEPSVSTVVDGVVLARPGQATLELLDIDHIEVLRGPQGTLFGKNASAGVINIVTTEPTADTHGYVDGAYFNRGDEWRIKGGLSGELLPGTLLGQVSLVGSGYDGNVKNLFNGTTVDGYDRHGGHTKLVFTASDALKITFNADYLHSHDTVPTGVPASSGQVAYPSGVFTNNAAFATALGASGVHPSLTNADISDNVESDVRDENGGASITVDAQLGEYTLTSITAYRRWVNVQHQDYDQLSALTAAFPVVEDVGHLSFNQVSEEARIASPKGHFIDYVAGLYYLRAVDDESYFRDVTQLKTVPVTNNGYSAFGTHANNYSVFGEGNLNFTDSFRGILGARLVRDELNYRFDRISTSPVAVTAIQPSFVSAGATGNYGYTDRVGLQYDFTPNVHGYLTYSHGYTGPAYNVFFNMAATATIALKPETSNAYELGLKSLFFENRLLVNLAGYVTNFQNYQANFADTVNGAIVTRLINAGSVSTKGLEGDLAYRPIDNATLSAAFARSRARVDRFNCPINAAASCNINGQPLPFAPDWKVNVAGNYVIPVTGSRQVIVDTDYKWQSKEQYQLTETPDTIQGSYGILDASLALNDTPQNWRITALVKNLTDKQYSSYLAHGNLAGLMRWVPRDNDRYVGIDVRKSF